MAQNLTVAGAASFSPIDGSAGSPISLAITLPFTSRADFSRTYAAVATADVVNFGTLAVSGAKGVLVVCTAGSGDIKFNGATDAWPLHPGGYFLWVDPTQPFPTSALIDAAAGTTIIFLAVG